MKYIIAKALLIFSLISLMPLNAVAETASKAMALDFQLDDLTELPNRPEELARIALLSSTFKQRLVDNGITLVPVNDAIKAEQTSQSATYLFTRTDVATKLAAESGADYVILCIAMKPTFLFVYPRLLLVDVKTGRIAFTAYAQLESSWSDSGTTILTGKTLADKVTVELKKLSK